jgi:hypothetical protein
MARGREGGYAAWWLRAALSLDALVVVLSLIAGWLVVTSRTNRQEEVAFLAIEGVLVTACAAIALSVPAVLSNRRNQIRDNDLVIAPLLAVIPLGLVAGYFVYWVYTG